jgi:hypothetical protein
VLAHGLAHERLGLLAGVGRRYDPGQVRAVGGVAGLVIALKDLEPQMTTGLASESQQPPSEITAGPATSGLALQPGSTLESVGQRLMSQHT